MRRDARSGPWACFGLVGAALVGVASCGTRGTSDDGPIASSAAAIVNGVASTAAQDFVVQIVRPVGNDEAYVCSGSLIAPNLVLTARHCVSETADVAFTCLANGDGSDGGAIGSDFVASTLDVFVGVSSPGTFGSPDAVGAQIIHDDGTTICDHDIALLVLDHPLTGLPIATLNLDSKPSANELITSVGWGVLANGDNPTVRQQRTGVAVLAVGPGTDPGGYVVGANEFDVGEDICEGDSGGPALDPVNAVVGVVSRGGNGSNTVSMNPAATCLGPQTTNFYTSTAGFKQLILQGFTAAGATPMLAEVPMGESCATSSQCASSLSAPGLCATIEAAEGNVCTQACENGACPSGFRCNNTASALPLCEAAPSSGGAGGCAVAAVETSSREWLGAGGLMALLGGVTARRRSRSRRK
jgi:Trypsin